MIVITLGLRTGCIGSIFITGIFGNFYTKQGGIFYFQNGNSRWPCYIAIESFMHAVNVVVHHTALWC